MQDLPGRAWLAAAGRWLKGVEFSLLLTLVLILGGIWLFLLVANEAVTGDPRGLDREILLALRDPGRPDDPIGPPWVETAMRDLTALGGTAVLLILTAGVLGYFLLRGEYHLAALVLLTVAGGAALSNTLKYAFDRPRPELVPALTTFLAPSFPSGHSTLAAATYLTLGSLVARAQEDRRLKIYTVLLAILLALLVGFSRVYLGVHWPTDVLGGWLLGALWATLMLLLSRWWRRRTRP